MARMSVMKAETDFLSKGASSVDGSGGGPSGGDNRGVASVDDGGQASAAVNQGGVSDADDGGGASAADDGRRICCCCGQLGRSVFY
jgi:hypothetical protein